MKKYPDAVMVSACIAMVLILAGGCEKTEKVEFPKEDKITAGIFLEPEERFVLPPGVEIRKVYDKALELTKVSEGFRSNPYNDAARYCTIGYGHLIHLASCDSTIPAEFRQGISEPRGEEILRDDMGMAERGVMSLVDVDLTDGQYGALCDFVFNVGVGNFRNSTLRKRVNAGAYDRVPFEFRRWVYAGGNKLPGLETRREQEIALFFEDIGIPRAAPPPDQDMTPIDIRIGETGS
ncbi:MAG: lysozyme [Desulfatiglandaceae bacterium]